MIYPNSEDDFCLNYLIINGLNGPIVIYSYINSLEKSREILKFLLINLLKTKTQDIKQNQHKCLAFRVVKWPKGWQEGKLNLGN